MARLLSTRSSLIYYMLMFCTCSVDCLFDDDQVLGEYNHCVRGVSPQQVLTALLHWYTKSSDDRTHCQILAALQKMAYYITDPRTLINVLKHKHRGHQDYCYELKQVRILMKQADYLVREHLLSGELR